MVVFLNACVVFSSIRIIGVELASNGSSFFLTRKMCVFRKEKVWNHVNQPLLSNFVRHPKIVIVDSGLHKKQS